MTDENGVSSVEQDIGIIQCLFFLADQIAIWYNWDSFGGDKYQY